jgi:predicted AAA+ superfamily ATPase
MTQRNLFNGALPMELGDDIRGLNPHWDEKPGPPIPTFRRWVFTRLMNLMTSGLTPAAVLRGPRRVGKTVLMRQMMEQLRHDGVDPRRILYVPFDEIESLRGVKDPVLSIARWYEQYIVRATLNELARRKEEAYILLDEVQNLDRWAPQVKHLVDNYGVRLLVTGSSSLRIEAGRDSLAGRITTVDLGPLLLREIAQLRFGYESLPFWDDNGLEAVARPAFWHEAVGRCKRESQIRWLAFAAFSERGGYPIAHERHDMPWHEVSNYLNETVIKRAIQHDLRKGPRGVKRDEKLLEEVFRLCCRYAGQCPGQSVFVPEIQQALAGNIGWNRILSYLRFLDGTLLVRLVQPLELRIKRRKSPPKICLCDHTLRAGWLQEVIPLDPETLQSEPQLHDLAGHLAESTLGYFLAGIPNLDLACFPGRSAEPEVDFVLTVGTRRIPVEVKYRRRIDPHEDTRGLRAFLEKTAYNAPFGLLVTLDDEVTVPDPRIIPISLSSIMWLR